tara:strand:+ start:2025 stop:2177 length:153 start_codon:yes stop_codon:yes gene_type:complete
MKIDTKIIKKVLYGIDPEAAQDKEFVDNINMFILLMEQEQKKLSKKKSPK